MSNLAELQLTKSGDLRHFLTPEGLDRIMLERFCCGRQSRGEKSAPFERPYSSEFVF